MGSANRPLVWRLVASPLVIVVAAFCLHSCVTPGVAPTDVERLVGDLSVQVEELARAATDPVLTPEMLQEALGAFVSNTRAALDDFSAASSTHGLDLQEILLGALILLLGGKEAAAAWALRRGQRALVGAATEPQRAG